MTSQEEKLKEDIIDWFIQSWETQKFPIDLKIKNYAEARIFREFWLLHCEFNLQQAINYFLAKKDEKQG